MEENRNKRKIIKRALIGATAVSLITLGTMQPVIALGVSACAFWTIPGIVMSKEISSFEKERNKVLSLNYKNNKKE